MNCSPINGGTVPAHWTKYNIQQFIVDNWLFYIYSSMSDIFLRGSTTQLIQTINWVWMMVTSKWECNKSMGQNISYPDNEMYSYLLTWDPKLPPIQVRQSENIWTPPVSIVTMEMCESIAHLSSRPQHRGRNSKHNGLCIINCTAVIKAYTAPKVKQSIVPSLITLCCLALWQANSGWHSRLIP